MEVQDDITRKQQLLYAIDYNKELINQLEGKSKQYEEILGITTERNEDVFWEHVNAERERFFRFIGAI